MAIHEWPESERPREKLLRQGASSLSDAELLAIFLRTGMAGVSAVDLARGLLGHFGSLQALFQASQPSFCEIKGLGPAKFAQLQAVLEMSRRYLYEELGHKAVLTSAKEVKQFLALKMQGYEQEVFACLFLDTQHQLLRFEEMFRGTVNQAPVFPREIAKQALRYNAAAIILAHNHPSGVAEPSQADKRITENIVNSLKLLDISVLDHFVVGGSGEVYSFAEHGLL